MRERAVTLGKIADVLYARGELDEALRIRLEEELPVYKRLGDARSRAVALGKIADVLIARGELDEALRTLREDLLPVFERLGDVRSRAVTLGKIADVLYRRGELDEALRTLREDVLPALERMGDARSILVNKANTAIVLLLRNSLGDRDEAKSLLLAALESAAAPGAGGEKHRRHQRSTITGSRWAPLTPRSVLHERETSLSPRPESERSTICPAGSLGPILWSVRDGVGGLERGDDALEFAGLAERGKRLVVGVDMHVLARGRSCT